MDQFVENRSGGVLLHARHEHGGHPVRVIPGDDGPAFEVDWSARQGGAIVTYPSSRQLVRALCNGGNIAPTARDPGMTFERYFKVGRFAREDDTAGPTIFDYFGVTPLPPEPSVDGLIVRADPQHSRAAARARHRKRQVIPVTVSTLALFGDGEAKRRRRPAPDVGPRWADINGRLSVEDPRRVKKGAPLSVDPGRVGPIGIDLENRSHEVRKLLFAGFGARIARAGYDPDDVLQEVYKGLLARNRGTCRFDPSKSSFGHYVHMVCGCVLANYHRKQVRLITREQVGMYVRGSSESEVGKQSDAALGAVDADGAEATEAPTREARAIEGLRERVLEDGATPDATLAADAIPFVYAGCSRAEIAEALHQEPSKVGKALAFLRSVAHLWSIEEGLRLRFV